MRHTDMPEEVERTAAAVLRAAAAVRRELGPGLVERAYAEAFTAELKDAGIQFVREVGVPLVYKGRVLQARFFADVIVDGHVLVEFKAVERILDIHEAQTLTYTRLALCPIGLLLNFGSRDDDQKVRRFVFGENVPSRGRVVALAGREATAGEHLAKDEEAQGDERPAPNAPPT